MTNKLDIGGTKEVMLGIKCCKSDNIEWKERILMHHTFNIGSKYESAGYEEPIMQINLQHLGDLGADGVLSKIKEGVPVPTVSPVVPSLR